MKRTTSTLHLVLIGVSGLALMASAAASFADDNTGGKYLDHDAVMAAGGVGNYLVTPAANGPSGNPLAHEQAQSGRYLDQKDAQAMGGVSNYVLPGDRLQMAGTVPPEEIRPSVATQAAMVSTLSKLNDDLFFDRGRSDVKPEAKQDLQKLASLLSDDRSGDVHIRAYTDSSGTEAYNDALSRRRARAVAEVLINSGLSENRVVARGFGEREDGNDSSAGREANRRADVRVVSPATDVD